MSLSMYEVSVPVFASMLGAMSHVLRKAEKYAQENDIDPATLTTARHFEDMLPLTAQVQIATDMAKGCVSRLSGREVPKWEDNEQSFGELQARIAKALDYIGTFSPEDFEGSEDREVTLKIAGNEMTFPGRAYLLGFVHPNFYFHVTTAYSLMRAKGVPLGKADYFGRG